MAEGKGRILEATLIFALLLQVSHGQVCSPVPCPVSSLQRAGAVLKASTCGMPPRDFCYTDPSTSLKDCSYICNAMTGSPDRHPVDFMVDGLSATWWQSENGQRKVSIEYELPGNKTYEIEYVAIQFRGGYLPEAYSLQKSADFGQTLEPYQFFSYSCLGSYGLEPDGLIDTLTEPICQDLNDALIPITFQPLDGRPNSNSAAGGAWATATSLRVDFKDVHGNSCDPRDIYYAIEKFDVLAACKCNGHARRCEQNATTGQVYCVCEHNTQGIDCESCLPFYNNKPYEAGSACEICNCNDHSSVCEFNQTVYEASGNQNGGVCSGCQHNTAGNQCDVCAAFFYPNSSLPQNHPDVCLACGCNLAGVEGGNLDCERQVNSSLGACSCKVNAVGRQCDDCKPGFWNLTQSNSEGCSDCECDSAGTIGGSLVCDKTTGQCPCKLNVDQWTCSQCKDGYYNLNESNSDGCIPCNCNIGGAFHQTCDKETGQCLCKEGLTRRDCSVSVEGTFLPPLDYILYEAESTSGGSTAPVSLSQGVGSVFTGTGYSAAKVNDSIVFPSVSVPQSQQYQQYQLVIRYSYNDTAPWQSAQLTITPSVGCSEQTAMTSIALSDLQPGQGFAHVLTSDSCLRTGTAYSVKIVFSSSGSSRQDATLFVDSLVVIPVVDHLSVLVDDPSAKAAFASAGCVAARYTVQDGLNENATCKRIASDISAELYGRSLNCSCDSVGSAGVVCDSYTGQCLCKSSIFGRTCDSCLPGSYNFSASGCTGCTCDMKGSYSDVCDFTSGQCPCINLVDGLQCNRCIDDYFGFSECQLCQCNATGSTSTQCDDSGQCPCKTGIGGTKCTSCLDGYYNLSTAGCRDCECNSDGSLSITCSSTGVCSCKDNVEGDKCDICKKAFFNLESTNAFGCQPCFGYGHALDCSPDPDYTSGQVYVNFLQSADYEIVNRDDGAVRNPLLVSTVDQLENTLTISDATGVLMLKPSAKFYGNRLGSFAKTLSIGLQLDQNVSSDAYGGPDVVLMNFYGDTISTNLSPRPSLVRRSYVIRLDTTTNWTFTLGGSNESASVTPVPFDIQRVLVSLTSITIRASYAAGVGAVFDSVSLQVAVKTNVSEVDWAERSICPLEYVGTLCESCAVTSTRSVAGGDSYTSCVACECNGRAVTCDELTGVCDCKDNNAGNRCDVCAVGFYRNTSSDCLACPCPLTSGTGQFSTSCRLVAGVVECLGCPDGHTGDDCGQCLSGYFGDPFGIGGDGPVGCSNCSCNGNINASDPQSCNATTGRCLQCLYNTAGGQCEVCKLGYYGSALERNCTECACDSIGAVDNNCLQDSLLGECVCKPNVIGVNCERCRDGYFNFTDEGCKECECDLIGSNGTECNVTTGVCQCKVGVGGDKCDQCQDAFFGMGPNGCSACNCHPEASTAFGCNQTSGQCSCTDGSAGLKCDSCRNGFFNFSAGCLACDCNNHSSTCDVSTGICIACNDNTVGSHCEQCLSGYYGDATAGNSDDCVVCPCPGISSNDTFSNICELTAGGSPRCTNCSEGHTGDRCQFCSDGYSGDPLSSIGCQRCVCSGNIDLNATGNCHNVTGDCLKCLYNTDEKDCSHCLDGYYGNALARNCTDCSCDSRGSVGIICVGDAGKCICKPSTKGLKCDQCEDGFYNLTGDGCSQCQCNVTGSSNDACNDVTGVCQCKPGVEGTLCDRCASGFYGFAPDGCKECGCSSTGANGSNCDVVSGQCSCISTTTGRTCGTCITGHFDVASGCIECNCNNHTSTCNGIDGICLNCQDNTKGDHCEECADRFYGRADTGRPSDCRPCPCPLTSSPGNFSNTCRLLANELTVECTGCPPSHSGLQCESCADGFYGDPAGGVGCLACDCNGNVNLTETDFCDKRTGICRNCIGGTAGDYCEVCADHFYGDPIVAKNCTACECDLTGVVAESVCDGTTGQCHCLPHVVGDRCNACEIDHWNLSFPSGCDACDCHPLGAMATNCDVVTGQCRCRPGVGGRQCDECLSGYFNMTVLGCQKCSCSLPGSVGVECNQTSGQCECSDGARGLKCDACLDFYFNLTAGCHPCICNGHATDCDLISGVCIDCQHNTQGDHCEECWVGFYGDATNGTANDCIPCPCPEISANTSFSPTCGINNVGEVVCDDCAEGHTGNRCEVCDAGYHGNPAGGIGCSDCSCSGNIDPTDPGSCDSTTGRCLECLYNTAGDMCQLCRDGYYGNASIRNNCTQCPCNAFGTLSCDRSTGGCICKLSVSQPRCDRCDDFSYDITNPDGCLPCQCNATGSKSFHCNEINGTCSCKAGVGGDNCDLCALGFYDFRNDGCRSCDCNLDGSTSPQCDGTGQCPCQTGVTGPLCDRCAENYVGNVPRCVRCASCYDDLQVLVDYLRSRLDAVLLEINQFASTQPNALFSVRLADVSSRLDLLESDVRTGEANVTSLRDQIADIDGRLTTLQNEATALNSPARDVDSNADSLIVRAESIAVSVRRTKESVTDAYETIEDTIRPAADSSPTDLSEIQSLSQSVDDVASAVNKLSANQTTVSAAIDASSRQAKTSASTARILAENAWAKATASATTLLSATSTVEDRRQAVHKIGVDLMATEVDVASIASAALNVSNRSSESRPDFGTSQLGEQLSKSQRDLSTLENEIKNVSSTYSTVENDLRLYRDQLDTNLLEVAEDEAAARDLNRRSDDALAKGQTAVDSGATTLAEAKDMLDILTNFNDRIAATSASATSALEKVDDIRNRSDVAIVQAREILQNNQMAFQDAESAESLAQTAEDPAKLALDTAMSIRSDVSELLKKSPLVELDAIAERSEATSLNDTANGLVSQCTQNRTFVDNRVASAETATNDISTCDGDAEALRLRGDQLKNDLKNLDRLDDAAVQSIRQTVDDLTTRLESVDLAAEIESLRSQAARQRSVIAKQEAEEATLRQELEEVKTDLGSTCV